MSIRKGNDILAYGKIQVEAMQRSLGEIVYSSIPLDNESYHLADGSVLSYSDYPEFVNYMGTLYDTYGTGIGSPFCSQSDWDATATLSVTGSCGKYVYNTENNTVKLPKYNGILEGTTTNSYVGNLTEAGLPTISTVTAGAHTHSASTGGESAHTHTRGTMDIKGSFQGGKSGATVSGVFTKASGVDSYASGTYDMYTVSFTASKNWTGSTSGGTSHTHTATINSAGGHTHALTWSSTIQNTNTVQPETTKVLVYIVVKAIAKSVALVNFDNYVSDLNQKADSDLSNLSLSQSAKHNIGRLYFPSNNYVNITLPTSGNSVTAPADGFFACAITGTVGSSYMELAVAGTGITATANYCGGWGANFIPVRQGDVVYVYYGGTTFTLQFFRFIYAESEV